MTTELHRGQAGRARAKPQLERIRGVGRLWPGVAAGLMLCCLAVAPAMAETIADGIAAYRQGDYQRARDIWRPLAEQGDAVAQFNLGKLYEFGGGEMRQDYSQAARWYREAAAQGVAAAQNNLGLMHSQGLGVPRDAQRAAELWTSAAEADYSLAQYNLALAYFRGEGVTRNERVAALWFEKAAQAGLPDAQYAMGQLLRLGRVAGRDEGQALTWYQRAAAQGHSDAAQQAGSLEERGVAAKEPVPLEPAAEEAAAPPEPEQVVREEPAADRSVAEQPAMPEAPSADTAMDVEPAEGEATAADDEAAQRGVALEVPVPEPKPEALAMPAAEADTTPQQTAALPAPEEAAATEPATEYRLWLVSADSEVAAEDLRNQTLARHAHTLGTVELSIYEIDHGERGHFYRVLAGPLFSADAANDLCRRLREDDPQGFCKVLTR